MEGGKGLFKDTYCFPDGTWTLRKYTQCTQDRGGGGGVVTVRQCAPVLPTHPHRVALNLRLRGEVDPKVFINLEYKHSSSDVDAFRFFF